MRFTPIAVSAFVLALTASFSTVSAQQNNWPCSQCIINASLDGHPDCNEKTFLTDNDYKDMTPKEKSCWCALASSDGYLQKCIKSGVCSKAEVKQSFDGVAAIKDQVCVGGTPSKPSVTSPGPVKPTSPPPKPSPPTTTTRSKTRRPSRPTTTTRSKTRRPSRPTTTPRYDDDFECGADCDVNVEVPEVW